LIPRAVPIYIPTRVLSKIIGAGLTMVITIIHYPDPF
jgi:hypothetical protein